MSRPSRHSLLRLALLAALLSAFALRVARLDSQELRGDEAFGYFFAQRSYAGIVAATVELQEPHPVASYFLLKPWLEIAGDGEFALRFLGVCFAVLAVALLARLGRSLELPPGASAAGAALLALSPYAVWHAQDARMYNMSLALTLASAWLAVEWLRGRNLAAAAGYIAVSWLALHTHYFAVFVLAAQAAFVVARALARPVLRAAALSLLALQALVAALYLPWLARAGDTLTAYRGNGDSPGFLEMVGRALAVFAVGESAPAQQRLWFALAAAALLLLGLAALWRQGETGRRAALYLGLYLAVPLLATWLGSRSRPIFNERYLVAAAPPFYLLAGCALAWPAARRRWRWAGAALAALLAVGMALSLGRLYADAAYSKTRGWRELAAALERLSAGLPPDQVRIAQNFPDPTLWYYYRGPVEHVVLPPAAHDAAGAAATVADLAQSGVQRVLLPLQPAPQWDDAGLAAAALEESYTPAAERQVGVWPLRAYARPGELAPLAATFGNGVTLAGVAAQPETLPLGGLLTVHLAWDTAGASLSGSEKVFVHLLDPAGALVAQDDRPLAANGSAPTGDRPATYGIILPDSLAPGVYRLVAGLYDPAQPGAPRFLTETGLATIELGIFNFDK